MMILVARQLTESQVREVLARAEQIHLSSGITSDTVLKAAEEAGLPREAVEQALRERFHNLDSPPAAGELVFAKSGDDCFYVAKVLESSAGEARVEFLAGGTRKLPLHDLRQASFSPGQRLVCNWPNFGWNPARVANYDAEGQQVTVRGWAATETIPLSDVRIEAERERPAPEHRKSGLKIYLWGLFSGGLLTTFALYILTR